MRAVVDRWGASLNKKVGATCRVSLCAALALTVLAIGVPSAQAAISMENFTAGVLLQNTTAFKGADACDVEDAINMTAGSSALYATQAGSHPYCGATSFQVTTANPDGTGAPSGTLADVRVDLPPGLIPNPLATPQCPQADFGSCPADTQVGTESVVAYITSLGADACYGASNFCTPSVIPPLGGAVPIYNMVPSSASQVSDFAFSVSGSRVDVIGGDRYVPSNGQPGDYGAFFTISNLPKTANIDGLANAAIQLVKSTLVFFGNPTAQDGGAASGGTAFLTNPSTCVGQVTTYLSFDSYEAPGQYQGAQYKTPVGASGCGALTFPAAPSLSVTPTTGTTFARDTPSGLNVSLTVPQQNAYDSGQVDGGLGTPLVNTVTATLPPGFTINPAAAGGAGLQTCTDAAFGVGTTAQACPNITPVGSVSISSPVLATPLTGNVYLGTPQPGNPYRLFVDAESPGVAARLVGSISPDPTTGQLTTTFTGNPQVPFNNLTLQFNGGPGAVIASPLACGAAGAAVSLVPYSGAAAGTGGGTATVAADGQGTPCGATPPFSPTVSAQYGSLAAGAKTALTLDFARGDGQQYLSSISASLPPGLLGLLASVPLCGEPAATQGTCPATSAVGSTTISAGAGSQALTLSAPVYLTGPYNGAPFGLSIPVAAVAGPYNLGTVVVRAGISVNPLNAQISIASTLPQVVGGIPLRLKNVSIAINRAGFLFNPTSCAASAFGGSIGGAAGAYAGFGTAVSAAAPLSIGFAATGCGNLAFAPAITASTNGKTSATNGASLNVTVKQPAGGSNLHSVGVTLPKQLSARLATVQLACPAAKFAANPASCPADSVVGSSTAVTPVLTTPLQGVVYLVSSASIGLPDLDVVLAGSGVTVDLIGTVGIGAQGTTSTFASIPDVPISTFTLNLTEGPHSALTASAPSLCPGPLKMPTQLAGQNGAKKSPTVSVTVTGCAKPKAKPVVSLVSHSYAKGLLHLKVRVAAAGRVSAGGPDLRTRFVKFTKASTKSFTVRVTAAGVRALSRHHKLAVKLRLGFVPKKKGRSTIVHPKWTIKVKVKR